MSVASGSSATTASFSNSRHAEPRHAATSSLGGASSKSLALGCSSISEESWVRAYAAPDTQALRGWQRRALVRYLGAKPRDLLAVATPGAGQKTFALRIAGELLPTAPSSASRSSCRPNI